MNRGHARNFQAGDAIENALPFRDEIAHLATLRLFQERLEIGAGDEDRLLGRGDNYAAQRFVGFNRSDLLA